MHFGDQLEIVKLNIDNPDLRPLRSEFEITGRSQYLLVDGQGAILRRWYGPLNRETLAAEIEDALAAAE